MTKEKWIEHVLQSTDTLQEAEPSPFLLQKIQSRIGETQSLTLNKSMIVRWSIAASLLIILNLSAISYALFHKRSHTTSHSATDYPNQFNTGTYYNY